MKVVFIAGHEFAGNNNNGGKQGSQKLYNIWTKAVGEKNVFVVMFSNVNYQTDICNIKYFNTHHSKIGQMKNAFFFRNGYDRATEKKVQKYIESLDADIIYFDHSNTGYLLKNLNISPKTRVYVFMHNIEHDYVWNKVIYESIMYFVPFLSYWKNEKYIVNHADIVMNLNQRDGRRLEALYGRKSDYLIPVSYYDVYEDKHNAEKERSPHNLLFVGTYAGPNINGIEWFIRNVFPFLYDYELTIVGMRMEKLRNRVSNTKIHVVGTVNDISKYYYDADVVIIPLLYGAGMKTKTAEAMMYGKCIVATDEALEGYITDDENIIRANSKEQFISVLNGKKIHKKYYQGIRDIFLKNYCTTVIEERFVEFINEGNKHDDQ